MSCCSNSMITYTASTVAERIRSHCRAGKSPGGTLRRRRDSVQLVTSVCSRPFLIRLISVSRPTAARARSWSGATADG
jgi:hypothetical protein